MKKISSVVLVVVALLSVGCANKTTKYTRYSGPVYVSSAKYEKISCKALKSEFYYFNNPSCEMLRKYFLLILPTEYEKLSCKQLHEQFIKIDRRREQEKDEAVAKIIGVPILILTTGGLALLDDIIVDPMPNSKLDPKRVSETITAKEAYETLKEVATNKNCSFVKDMRDLK